MPDERVLSQDEVDALMKGVSDGEIDTGSDESVDADGARMYDLSSQDRVIRGRMPTMEMINERFSRLYRNSLFTFINKVADVNVDGVRMMKYGEFLRNVPLPTSLNIFKLSPLRGMGLLVFDANLIFLILDTYFGGKGQYHARVEGREFTGLELRIIRKLVKMFFDDMKKSWQSVLPLEFIFSRSEVNPQFANVLVPTEVVIVSSFDVEIESSASKLSICIPYSSVEPIKEKLYAGYQTDRMDVDKRWVIRLEEEIRKTSLLVSCNVGGAVITVEDLLNLNVDDVIQLNSKPTDPVKVDVEGVEKFRGRPGVAEERYAVQIDSCVAND